MFNKIDILLSTEETESDESVEQSDKKSKMSDFAFLKTDPGAVGLGSFLTSNSHFETLTEENRE